MRSLADYAVGVDEGWSKDTMARVIVHDLPRQLITLDRAAGRCAIPSRAMTGR